MPVVDVIVRWRTRVVALACAGVTSVVVGAAPPLRSTTDRVRVQVAPVVQRPSVSDVEDVTRRAAAADTLAAQAMVAVRRLRERVGMADPERSSAIAAHAMSLDRLALIGTELTPLVTTVGTFELKLLTTDPRWAGLLVRQLATHGVGPDSTICASFSGSFPGLNLAVIAASRALGARLIAISSVTASHWGANEPGLTWPEMEAAIVAAGVLPRASIAISLGGTRDSARDLDADAQALARRIQASAARDLGAKALQTTTLAEAIAARIEVYKAALGGRRPAVYVNVGGNHASLGGAKAPLRHNGGWLTVLPPGGAAADSVIHAHLADGVPVLSLLNITSIAKQWGLEARIP
jgi:poly-gamma-glutamate system protein